MQLVIELKSPLCAGSGVGRAGYVDRDVVFDSAGLPYIPGRRLKGLLRDSYSQVLQTPLKAGLPRVEELFGKTGKTGDLTGGITIGDAHLPDADRLRPWLLAVYRKLPQTLQREDVIAEFTEIRRQTAMSRHTGAPEENTLRATRYIRAGLRFNSTIGGPAATHREALEYAGQALQFMGSSRTRGPGWVKCKFNADPASHADLSPTPNGGTVFKSQKDALCFSVSLESAALFPNLAGDANTVLSHPSIPGSALLGLFAQRYLSQNGNKADEAFYELFCSEKLTFVSANLEIAGADARRRSTPVPHSIRSLKRDENEFWNLAVAAPQDEPVRRVSGWTALNEVYRGGKAGRAEPSMELRYHHAQASDRSFGRALGEKAAEVGLAEGEEPGALFTYESLSAGQTFLGEILGPPELLAKIHSLIADGERVRLGRSRSAQYGGSACWHWEDKAATETTDRGTPAQFLLVTLLSPLLAFNRWGHPAPEFPTDELARMLGVNLTLDRAFTRTHWQGGYLSHQGLPRLHVPALAGGSVFVFKVEDVSDLSGLTEKLASASARSFGLRQEEGFGRIDVRWKSNNVSDRPKLLRHQEPESGLQLRTATGSPEWKLIQKVLRSKLIADAQAAGFSKAGPVPKEALDKITPHLLHRLLSLIAKTPAGGIALVLSKQLAEKPRRVLEHCLIPDSQGGQNLAEFLSRSWEDIPKELIGFYLAPHTGWPQLAESNPFSEMNNDEEFAKDLAKRYLRSFLTALAWRKKTSDQIAKPAVAGAQA